MERVKNLDYPTKSGNDERGSRVVVTAGTDNSFALIPMYRDKRPDP